jgi:phosphatidylinositol alpha-1,6-mannosyltransferase
VTRGYRSTVTPERVLILTPGFSGFDGISTMAREAASALRDPRWALEVWSLGDTEVPAGRGADGRRDRFLAWALSEGLRPRVGRLLILALHIHLAVVAVPLRARGARLALFLHGIEAWGELGLTRRFTLKTADLLLANSAHTSRRIQARHGLRAEPFACHLGLPELGPSPSSAPVPPGFVLSAGRLAAGERYKGTDALLDAWAELARAVPGARLVVVGDGDDRERLESKAAPLGDLVRFLGRVEPDALERLYRDCALFALPSTGEGFGLVYLEAMRAGKAVIAGPGAPEEVVEEGVTGRIVDPARQGALLGALRGLLGDGAAREAMGIAGRARFLARFTSAHFAERLRAGLGLPARSPPPATSRMGS